MPGRKSYLVRLPEELLDELNRWAKDDLRSLNGQIEFLLRRMLQEAGRLKRVGGGPAAPKGTESRRR